MFKITEETLEQEVATYLQKELEKEGLECDLITQATPISIKKRKGEQLDILLIIENHKLVIELEIGKSWTQFAHGIAQAHSYKDHLGADGILTIMYPEEARRIAVTQEEIIKVALNYKPQVLLLTPFLNDFQREMSLPLLIELLKSKIKAPKPSVSIPLVVHTLRDCVQALSSRIRREKNVLERCIFDTVGSLKLFHIITEHDKDLSDEEKEDFKIFMSDLSSYILINQLLLYHILMKPLGLPFLSCLDYLEELNDYFKKIKDINYKAVYQVGVLKNLPQESILEVNTAILALKAIKPELVPHDLLGRLLHEFLPFETRKHFGTFYTKPIAAELLAWISIDDGNEIVFDPACGSGTLLVAAYNRKKSLSPKKTHKKMVEEELIGIDVMPFAAHLSALNLTIQERVESTDKTRIGTSNSLLLKPGSFVEGIPIQFEMFSEDEKEKLKENSKEIEHVEIPEKINSIIMNPPFTRKERLTTDMKGQFDASFSKPQNYWAYFLALSDSLIGENGKIGAVLPRDFFKGQFSEDIRKWLFVRRGYNLRFVIKTTLETAFSENAQFRDFLVVLEKQTEDRDCNIVYLKKKLDTFSVPKIREVADIINRNRDKEGKYEDEKIIITKVPQSEIRKNSSDLWGFVGYENPKNAKVINDFLELLKERAKGKIASLRNLNVGLIRGLEPSVKNLLNAIFVVRPIEPNRIRNSRLILQKERKKDISFSLKGTQIIKSITKNSLSKGLKTPAYLDKIAVDAISDFLIIDKYRNHKEIEKFIVREKFSYEDIQRQAFNRLTNLVISRKFNLIAPGTKCVAFFSKDGIIPGKSFWSLISDVDTAKALSLWINSIISWIQIHRIRTETEGGYGELTKEDIYGIFVPIHNFIKENKDEFMEIFDRIKDVRWSSIVEQLSSNFPGRKELDLAILELIGFKREELGFILPDLYKALSDELKHLQGAMTMENKKESPQSQFFEFN